MEDLRLLTDSGLTKDELYDDDDHWRSYGDKINSRTITRSEMNQCRRELIWCLGDVDVSKFYEWYQ